MCSRTPALLLMAAGCTSWLMVAAAVAVDVAADVIDAVAAVNGGIQRKTY